MFVSILSKPIFLKFNDLLFSFLLDSLFFCEVVSLFLKSKKYSHFFIYIIHTLQLALAVFKN